ncbi:MAG: peptidoglycan DD-metalloendopeptidase family protein [Gammaproteobacteria bacterium]|nr:peptidoglycan DD-metalloendopeptidase family protein [Gammaproteobacteria bacterium]MDH5652866.1 peptidoglycan DD-metalloendopeptidase family protein [Gammaproteobacteria bacterium]
MVFITLIAGCGHKGVYSKGYYSGRDIEKPVEHHVIKKGETLYSLAWQYGYDYREVAKWNGIEPPYTIYPDQKLRILPTFAERRLIENSAPILPKTTRPETTPEPVKESVKEAEAHVENPITPPKQVNKIEWTWPTNGKILATFSGNDPGRKGIDITGKPGQSIHAAASGKVVYSGSGLRGYGKLIIVKHDETYFSAYAHNKEIVVNEGQSVKKGERIADMGSTGTDRVKLHFEIRRNGIPVNPFYYLPKQ